MLGAGRWGRILIEAVADVMTLSGIATTGSAESMSWIAERFAGVPHEREAAALLRSGCHDAVVVATPSQTHAGLVRLALDAGLHVFVEKPISTSRAEVEELRRVALERDRELFVGYVYLHEPAFEALRDLVADDPPTSISVEWNRPHLVGPVHWELLPHELAVLSVLWGEPPVAIGVDRGSDRHLECEVRSASGRRAAVSLSTDAARPKARRVEVRTPERAYLWSAQGLACWQRRWQSVPVEPFPSAVERELARFAANIESPAQRMVHHPSLLTDVTDVIERTFA